MRALLARYSGDPAADSVVVADASQVLALALKALGREHGEAVSLLERAAGIYRRHLGTGHWSVTYTLRYLALALQDHGELSEARRMFQQILALRREATGTPARFVAESLMDLCFFHQETGLADSARIFGDAAVACWKAGSQSDSYRVAEGMNWLGREAVRAGEWEQAVDFYRTGLEIEERIQGPKHVDVAALMANFGGLLTRLGRLEEARPYLERAVAIFRPPAGVLPDYRLAQGLTNLGEMHANLGNLADARACFEESLDIHVARKAPGRELAEALFNLAEVDGAIGQLDRAHATYDRALQLIDATPDSTGEIAGVIHEGLGALALKKGDAELALASLSRAHRIAETAFGMDHPHLSSLLHALAEAEMMRGETQRAHPLLEQATRILVRAGCGESREMMRNLQLRATLALMEGNGAAGLEAALECAHLSRERFLKTVTVLAEREALLYRDSQSPALALAIEAAEIEGRRAEDAERILDEVVRSRALVLDEMIRRQRVVHEEIDPRAADLGVAVESANRHLANLIIHGPVGNEVEEYREQLQASRARKERAERELAAASRRGGTAVPAAIGLAEVRENLPTEAALVCMVRGDARPKESAGRRGGHSSAEMGTVGTARARASYSAFVLRDRRSPVVLVPLGPAAAIDSLVMTWRAHILTEASETTGDRVLVEEQCRQVGEVLRRNIWDPIALHLGDVPLVFVVPDGMLHLVNYAALPLEEARYLVEDSPLFHYLSAERDLARPPKPALGCGYLSVCDPDYDCPLDPACPSLSSSRTSAVLAGVFRRTRSGSADFRAIRFHALAATRQEAERIEQLWRLYRSGEPSMIVCGAQATEGQVKIALSGKRVLHLATHGFFLEGSCPQDVPVSRGIGGLVEFGNTAAPGETIENVKLPQERNGRPPEQESPLILSGLAVAAANNRDQAGPAEEDGILTAAEIGVLDLRGTEWAVLSACDTGVGTIQAGEGMLGLRRAFQVAGAQAVITSLWPVEDEATREWMEQLYEARLAEGCSTAAAMRQAGRRVLALRRERCQSTHPFYWAGFVAAGEWR